MYTVESFVRASSVHQLWCLGTGLWHATPPSWQSGQFLQKTGLRCIASSCIASPTCIVLTWHQQIWIQHEICSPTNIIHASQEMLGHAGWPVNVFFHKCFLFFKVLQARNTRSLTCKRLPDFHVLICKQGAPFGNKRPTDGQFYLLLKAEIWAEVCCPLQNFS